MSTPWTEARNLLCVRLDAPGDVLTCTPAMRALRAQHPARRLTLLASPAGAALAPWLDDVDAAIAWDAPWTTGGAALPPDRQRDWIATLAAHRFDAAVIFTCYRQSALPAALLCQLAGIPLRLAYCRENPHPLLSDWIADPEPGMVRHAVQRQLDLVRRIGAEIADERLAFTPTPADIDAVRSRLGQAGIDPDGRWLALHSGAGASGHRHSAHYWQGLVRELGERVRCPLVFSGGQILESDNARLLSLAGKLQIGELGALLSRSSAVLTNNAGTAQLAAAVGAPVLHLDGLAHPRHAPWRVPGRVLGQGRPDQHAPSEVANAVCSLLKQTERYRRQEVRMRR